jgi:hypothetical protein
MKPRYLLYIDILGFSHLVQKDSSKVERLYDVLDSLNVHHHHAFTTIVFSDTVLVYNSTDPRTEHDHKYLVMYACEFAQDLLYRTIGTGVNFRAVLLRGDFEHQLLKNTQSFYGTALIQAYRLEKAIESTGLFIHESCADRNGIFPVSRYSEELSFVYLNQSLETLQTYTGGILPMHDGQLLEEIDVHWRLAFDVRMLADFYANMRTHRDPRVRVKFLTSWDFFMRRYPALLQGLVEHEFSLEAITSAIDWNAAMERVADGQGP